MKYEDEGNRSIRNLTFKSGKFESVFTKPDDLVKEIVGEREVLGVCKCTEINQPSPKFVWPKWLKILSISLGVIWILSTFSVLFFGSNESGSNPNIFDTIFQVVSTIVFGAIALLILLHFAYGLFVYVTFPFWGSVAGYQWIKGNRKGVDTAIITEDSMWSITGFSFNRKSNVTSCDWTSISWSDIAKADLTPSFTGKRVKVISDDGNYQCFNLDDGALVKERKTGFYDAHLISFDRFTEIIKEKLSGKIINAFGKKG